jgi:hypothetical protein
MTQYISKDDAAAEIKKRKKEAESNCGVYKSYNEHHCNACIVGFYEEFLEILNTLEVKEVDLEKELDSMITPELKFHKALPSLFDVAKHFYELGLKAQRKSISIQNVDDVLKESGVDPNSKVAKMFKESYYAAIDKLLEYKGE